MISTGEARRSNKKTANAGVRSNQAGVRIPTYRLMPQIFECETHSLVSPRASSLRLCDDAEGLAVGCIVGQGAVDDHRVGVAHRRSEVAGYGSVRGDCRVRTA